MKEDIDVIITKMDRPVFDAPGPYPYESPGGSDHYTGHAVEPIHLGMHMPFWQGSAIKYVARAGKKESEATDLCKAVWYIGLRLAELDAIDQAEAALSSAAKKKNAWPDAGSS